MALDQMLFQNLIDVRFINIGVPNPGRIDHDTRPFFAAVEAAGLVNSDFPVAMNIQRFCPRFRVLSHSDRIFTGTTLALAITLVDTEEDVVLIKL